jgi:hypothetical protein
VMAKNGLDSVCPWINPSIMRMKAVGATPSPRPS